MPMPTDLVSDEAEDDAEDKAPCIEAAHLLPPCLCANFALYNTRIPLERAPSPCRWESVSAGRRQIAYLYSNQSYNKNKWS